MAVGTDLLLALAFVAAIGVVFLVGKAVSNWVFELTPAEWGYTVVLAFSLGVLAAAYWDGDGLLELLALIPTFLAVVWWVYRFYRRHQVRTLRSEGA
jgi:cbb3-type cytochrome oxidase subunit 3